MAKHKIKTLMTPRTDDGYLASYPISSVVPYIIGALSLHALSERSKCDSNHNDHLSVLCVGGSLNSDGFQTGNGQ